MEGNGQHIGAGVEELIAAELDQSDLSERAADMVLAALLGDDELSAVVSGTRAADSARPPAHTRNDWPPTGLYLQSITVEGFRGVGPEAVLRLPPGPGLTIVAGRNGSGKSSLAEAAELALTGDDKRWSGRTSVWRSGWRNLHATGPSRISLELSADGQPGAVRVTREWAAGAELDDTEPFVQVPGSPRRPLTVLQLSRPLELFRPFLSYSELGALLSGKPSEMYDALQAILGLDQLIDAEQRLTSERKRLDEPGKQASKAVRELRARLDRQPDERARQAARAIGRRPWDLDTIEALATGAGSASDPVVARLAQVATITIPSAADAAAAISELVAARRRLTDIAGTPAAQARNLAGLLSAALAHQASHPGEPCPVCGARTLDDQWVADARAEMARLDDAARKAETAYAAFDAARARLTDLTGSEPAILTQDLGAEVDAKPAVEAWRSWATLLSEASAEDLMSSAGERFSALAASVGQLKDAAADVLRRRDQAWRPVAAELASWAAVARQGEQAEAALADVRQAIDWLREAGQQIRDARMAPITRMAAEVWAMLRQESNVDLGPIRLIGASTQRHVSLDVTVDGVAGAALSVMSQGELHALGLALFLPRATLADSPFRFVIIDDPVQSMDPAKVDGLARLLAEVGGERQVLVFTHDDRLPEAIRRLQLPATIWEMTRRDSSVVELTKNQDPVQRYIDDARAIALTDQLPRDVRAVVVAGFCRSALEAACHEAVRARRLQAGVRHAAVEQELARVQTTHELVTLALLDDPARGSELVPRIRRNHGQASVDAFHAIKSGTHAVYQGDLRHLVNETERLANAVRA